MQTHTCTGLHPLRTKALARLCTAIARGLMCMLIQFIAKLFGRIRMWWRSATVHPPPARQRFYTHTHTHLLTHTHTHTNTQTHQRTRVTQELRDRNVSLQTLWFAGLDALVTNGPDSAAVRMFTLPSQRLQETHELCEPAHEGWALPVPLLRFLVQREVVLNSAALFLPPPDEGVRVACGGVWRVACCVRVFVGECACSLIGGSLATTTATATTAAAAGVAQVVTNS